MLTPNLVGLVVEECVVREQMVYLDRVMLVEMDLPVLNGLAAAVVVR
jgi:hypothetical protein